MFSFCDYCACFRPIITTYAREKPNTKGIVSNLTINPLRPNSDLSQTSHCNFKGLSVSEVMRIENMITQVQFY